MHNSSFKYDKFEIDLNTIPNVLKKEIKKTIELAHEFNEEIVKNIALKIDQAVDTDPNYLPWELVLEANRRGFYTLWIPKMFGGKGYHPLSMLIFNEIIASECLGITNLIGAHYVGLALLSATFNFKSIQHICNEIVLGENLGKPCLLSTAITESNAGTDLEDINLIDLGDVQCTAKKVKDGYILNGSKVFISNAHLSSWHIVIAFENLKKPSESTVVLAVKSDTSGVSLGRIEKKMGQSACPASVLSFENCFIPDERVCLSSNGQSQIHRLNCEMLVDDVLALSRPGVAALATGVTWSAFKKTWLYCLQKDDQNDPLVNREWVQSLLADMYKNVQISRSLYWEAGLTVTSLGPFHMMNHPLIIILLKVIPKKVIEILLSFKNIKNYMNKNMVRERVKIRKNNIDRNYSGKSSMAKYFATDLAMENCQLALQVMGQYGYRHENYIEKLIRDTKLLQIYEGTNQLNRINYFKNKILPINSNITLFQDR